MKSELSNSARWLVVTGYAIAMAWVEAAVVYYLRTMVNRLEPHQPDPLPLMGGLGSAELIREAATLVMLITVGILAGSAWRTRLGYSAVAFGVWDIFYYIFLKALCGWPHSLLDWDVLFLLPLPWWGPVLAPVLISILMITWGTLASRDPKNTSQGALSITPWAVNACGVLMALVIFMSDSLRAASQGSEAVRQVLPEVFQWKLFAVALVLMAAPIIALLCSGWTENRSRLAMREPEPSGGRAAGVSRAASVQRHSI